jgi:glycosyl transferase, family 25
MEKSNFPPVFVVHISKGAEAREESIVSQMAKFKLDFEFMLRGDISDISTETHHSYFAGEMLHSINGVVSCALKHIYIYEEIIARNFENAIILEDDILLKPNFIDITTQALDELKTIGRDRDNYFISLETNGKFVNASEIKKNKLLHKKDKGRFAGAYLKKLKITNAISQLTGFIIPHRKKGFSLFIGCTPL